MPHRFYYLRGALGEEGLLAEQADDIRRLLDGDFTSSNLEKLKGHDVYSFRLSRGARLLFTLISFEERRYLLVLDYLPTHDYQNSRFLKSGVLRNYMDKITPPEPDSDPEFEPLEDAQLPDIQGRFRQAELDADGLPAIMDYFRTKFIELAPEQEDVLAIGFPAGIRGGAGAGKTATALSMIASYIDAHPLGEEEPQQRIVYATTSQALVEDMRTTWSLLPQAVDTPHEVLFKTIEDLIREDPEFATAQLVGQREFTTWYSAYLTQERKVAKATGTVLDEVVDAKKIYQEFRTCSGYFPMEYEHLGERQSLVSPEKRTWIYTANH